jgi:hypothetical protein
VCLRFSLILFFHVQIRILIGFLSSSFSEIYTNFSFCVHLRIVACHAHFIFSILVILMILYFEMCNNYEATLGTIFSILLPVSLPSFKYFPQPVTSSPCAIIYHFTVFCFRTLLNKTLGIVSVSLVSTQF